MRPACRRLSWQRWRTATDMEAWLSSVQDHAAQHAPAQSPIQLSALQQLLARAPTCVPERRS